MAESNEYLHLERRVKQAHRRFLRISLCEKWIRSLFYALVISCGTGAILKFTPWVEWSLPVTLVIVGISAPAAFLWFWINRTHLKESAILVDQHLFLKEKISSALELGKCEDDAANDIEWRKALLHDALYTCGKLDLRKAFPFQSPRELRWFWAPSVLLILTLFVLPQWDLITGRGQAQAGVAEQEKVEKELQKFIQRQLVMERRDQEKQLIEAAKISQDVKDLAKDLAKGKIDKREALAKLSSLEDEWEKRKTQLETMKPESSQMAQQMRQKMTGELAQSMQNSDFKKAADALKEIQKKLKMESMDSDNQKRLSDELSNLAGALEMNSPLAKALANAAKNLEVGDSQSAMKALQLAQINLSDLQEVADQILLLDQALQDLKSSKYAMTDQLGELGDLGNMMGLFGEGAGLGSGDGEGGRIPGVRPWQAGESRKAGAGMGGPGIGRGGYMPITEDEVAFETAKLKGKFGKGPLLGSVLVDGPPQKGESVVELSEAFFEHRQAEESALAKERVPIPYLYQVRAYFDVLQQDSANANSTGEKSASANNGASQ
ncbi:MAG: hypothetical protein C4527_02230 [Candidatus Omnitrophota bacterium]|jgi:hypothetical protein|nr:MAG: hypothetical protein C4527_02230 [Candidatus Omnitrophota bacterium]